MALLDPPVGSAIEQPATPAAPPTPVLAAGVELLGPMPGSGYREAPGLVRRPDGQVLQLTPTLYALADLVDGERDSQALAAALGDRVGAVVEPRQVDALVEKLRPLGLLRGADGAEPAVAKSNPLLALRCRVVISDEATTARLTRPFTWLFRPLVLWPVVLAFLVVSTWLLADHGLAQAARHVLYEPALLLVVLGLTVASAGFHELGHAAACRYGGGRPGVMGAGLYLVFPAFYTDVSDAYRLDRRSRLRTDLGGLYFNAVFAVAAFVVWWLTGWEALLVVVPLQQLQMLKQLAPFVRLDGYHVLADLTGVPDLFARIKPVLAGLLPWNRGRPEARDLKPWVRAVVTAWVLVVVPVLALALVAMIVTFPRLVATVWDSAGLQVDDLSQRWRDGDAVRTVLAGVSLVALVVPLLSVTYFLSRIARRTSRRVWLGTEGNPPLRFAAIATAVALFFVAAASWWPRDQYQPIGVQDRGTLGELTDAVTTLDATPAAATSPAPSTALAATGADEVASDRAGDVPLVVVEIDPGTLPAPLGPVPHHDFVLPDAPREGDNQALALNRTDGTVVNVSSGSLVWVFDGVVDEVNEAWALSNCRGCATQAVAFQVILVVGQADVVSPQNLAVAVNGSCASCVANAIARQLVLTLDVMPSEAELAQLADVWERVEVTLSTLGTVPLDELLAELEALELELVQVLAPSLADASPPIVHTTVSTTTTTAPTGASPTVDEPTSGTSTTTTDPPSPTTTTTEPPAETTTSTTVVGG